MMRDPWSGRRVLSILAALLFADVAAILVSGGFSFLGPTETQGVLLRIVLLTVLLLGDSYFLRQSATRWRNAYLILLLLMALVVHERGYRLRGDGLWYYSLAHSLAFDRDLDLANQYERLGIEDFEGSRPVRQTGLRRYTYPVGAPMLWIPWLALGNAGVLLRNLHGVSTSYDGFSDPYFHAVALGGLITGLLGMLVVHRLLRRWFEDGTAFLATIGVSLGSFLAFYVTYHAIYTHALTFLLIALVLERLLRDPPPGTVRDYAILGVLLALATSVRWQNATFSLLVGSQLLSLLLQKEWQFVAKAGGVFAAIMALGFVPQMLVWKTIYDSMYVGIPLGADYMRWGDPFVTETLFSSRHGLFSWSPILLVAVVGLLGFARSRPRTGAPLIGMLLLLTWVNSSVADWWAGGSYGARRFDSVLPILAIGLASAIVWTTAAVRRRPGFVACAFVSAFIVANLLLMEQYRQGTIPVDDTMSWESAARAGLEDVFDLVGYPFSFPMNWLFALRYDRPLTQYDILVGKYLFHRMGNLGGVIDLGPEDPPFVGNGWSGLRDWKDRRREVRHAIGERTGIFIPTDRPEALRIFIECTAPESGARVPIETWLNGTRLGAFTPTEEMQEHVFSTRPGMWRRINLLELIPAMETNGKPFLAVDKLRVERVQ